ncbi:hypothetical protein FH179_00170 [Staphylococcus haemolyticus]|nr:MULTISPECIES: DUF2231 domain-containing protein [Staphylococcus]MCE0454255.1 hypothetical protein [Staphylococcus haemolyticus]MCH4336222.1 hypothetical protein [Staphylococcus haemolyticus]MCH4476368.1 hypothetical protein [Staphylococcus haemolyticus]MCI2933038.1 hypothetical protein [Staphylococcus haemolyticus]MEB2656827.1 DUF2231 domain-containing protein [Staphylococcus haemolyticus]
MPLHPLFIHFPIALLSLATIISILHLFLKKINLSITLTTLLTTGMVFGIISYMLGDSGEAFAIQHYGVKHVEKLVHLHETFALASLIAYGLATLTQLGNMWFVKYKKICTVATIILTIIGLILLVIAGHLGASITYGK